MPIHKHRYPINWPAFSHWIRFARAKGRCECTGQCQMHTPNPSPRRCTELHGHPARWARGKIHLAVAHLCNCDPPCLIPAHVLATCQRCHLRIDRKLHTTHRNQTLKAKQKTNLTQHTHPANIITAQKAPPSQNTRTHTQ